MNANRCRTEAMPLLTNRSIITLIYAFDLYTSLIETASAFYETNKGSVILGDKCQRKIKR